MLETISPEQVNKICIGKFSTSGNGEKTVDDPKEIKKIVSLLQKEAERCPYFVDTPELTSFRIDLYKDQDIVESISVAGDFFCRDEDEEWYFMRGLEKTLKKCTQGILLAKATCAFKKIVL